MYLCVCGSPWRALICWIPPSPPGTLRHTLGREEQLKFHYLTAGHHTEGNTAPHHTTKISHNISHHNHHSTKHTCINAAVQFTAFNRLRNHSKTSRHLH
ncbi:hypothetical protein E2C01_021822 [Portunus trituberculatus]|uniref:Uncharacterized protein n=1 Tax=Portunus trituberculatus TaxID=210409 RepID=A0A5B7E5N4_PORTR|nr:hypothetical protein [Portunus trituberculatus]